MVIFQVDDSLAVDAHIERQSARHTFSRVTPKYTNLGFNSSWLRHFLLLPRMDKIIVDLRPMIW